MNRLCRLFTTAVCLFLGMAAFAQDGVKFRQLTYEQALAAAKAENKFLFIDCSTSWCGSCKTMSYNVFPQKAAGDYFNPRFVCLMMDMEKGEGPALAEKFNIRAYPTFLLIRPDGTEQYRIVGGDALPAFIAKVERGMDEKNSLSSLEKQYDGGRCSNEVLMDYYVAARENAHRELAAKLKAELKKKLTAAEKGTARFWEYFDNTRCYGEEDFQFVRDNEPALRKSVGEEKISGFIFDVFFNAIMDLGYGEEPAQKIAALKRDIEAWNDPYREILLKQFQIISAYLSRDLDLFIALMDKEKETMRSYPNFYLVDLCMQKFREARLGQEGDGKLYQLVMRLKPGVTDRKLMESLCNWEHIFAYRSFKETYFQPTTLAEALAEAKSYNNYVFVDCYTSWCGPCKAMMKNVFPQEKAGLFMNSHFRCIKMDMEKGEGPEVGKRYGVDAYPTFLVLDAGGNLVYKTTGAKSAAQLLAELSLVKGLESVNAPF